jgi:hypothetical protein
MASSTLQLEQRVAALEAEVTKLKSQMEAMQTTQPWWEQIAGTFQHDPMYEEAMRLGRQYRQSLRPRRLTQRQKVIVHLGSRVRQQGTKAARWP